MHDDSTLVFAYYKDGAADPTFLYFGHGLKEIKCWGVAVFLLIFEFSKTLNNLFLVFIFGYVKNSWFKYCVIIFDRIDHLN